jgi:hypothetical protein
MVGDERIHADENDNILISDHIFFSGDLAEALFGDAWADGAQLDLSEISILMPML